MRRVWPRLKMLMMGVDVDEVTPLFAVGDGGGMCGCGCVSGS